MSDILVTTPKSKMKEAEREAEYIKKNGGGYYFRVFKKEPSKGLSVGDRAFYVEDGYIRGY